MPDPLEPLITLLADRIAARVVERLTPILAAPPPEPMPTGLVDKRTAAKAVGVSMPTLDRLTREGASVHAVGARRRFDIAELRAWFTARGRKPTKASASTAKDDDIDVDDIIAAAGLRRR